MKKKLLLMKDMPYHIGLVVKFYPDYGQKHLIAVNDGAKRAVYACTAHVMILKARPGRVRSSV